MTVILTVGTPILLLTPDKYTDGMLNKVFGLFLATNVAAHSWIGLNYVATDYVPKISKSLLGPTRFLTAGLSLVTFLGLGKIALNDHGGMKAVVKGLWVPKNVEKKD